LTSELLDTAERIARAAPRTLGEIKIVMHLPPYSPELNPIEIFWKQAKYHWRRFVTWSKEQLLEEVRKLMQETGSTYKINFA
jgi:transposase